LAFTESTELKVCSAYIDHKKQQWLVQFLTTLHNHFKGLRGSILHHLALFSIDSVISKLLAQEIHLQSYSKKEIPFASNRFVLAVPSKSFSNQ
jgi:hypothetical protein